MKKFLAIFICVLLCGIFAVGCGGKKPEEAEAPANDEMIFGTWMEDYWDSGYTFNEDGTGKDIFWNQDFTYTALEGLLKISYVEGLWAEKEFNYSINGDVLTLRETVASGEDGVPGVWDYVRR